MSSISLSYVLPFFSVSINKKHITHPSLGLAGVTRQWRVFNELSCARGLKRSSSDSDN